MATTTSPPATCDGAIDWPSTSQARHEREHRLDVHDRRVADDAELRQHREHDRERRAVEKGQRRQAPPAGRRVRQVEAALRRRRGRRDHGDDRHRRRRAQPAVEVAGLVLREHEGQAEGRRGGEREGDTGADLAPLRRRAEARRGAEDVEREGEAGEHHRHREDDAALGPVRVEETRPERGPERIGVEGEQRERDRQPRHRRIEAQALHADEQADRRQRASMAPRQRQGNALDDEQRGDDERGDSCCERSPPSRRRRRGRTRRARRRGSRPS